MAATTEDGLHIAIEPPPRKIRKRRTRTPNPVPCSIRDEPTVKPCYCRFCNSETGTETDENITISEILRACFVKIVHHVLSQCLTGQGDEVDGNNSVSEFVKTICCRLSKAEIFWTTVQVAAEIDLCYFTGHTYYALENISQELENTTEPLEFINHLTKELPVHLKRKVCQKVTSMNYERFFSNKAA